MKSQIGYMASLSNFFDAVLFLLSSLVNIINGSGVTTTSFYKELPKIQKWEIHLSEFFPISGDWDELGIPNLARMSLIKCY